MIADGHKIAERIKCIKRRVGDDAPYDGALTCVRQYMKKWGVEGAVPYIIRIKILFFRSFDNICIIQILR